MKNFGFELLRITEKSYRSSGGAMPSNSRTRSSVAPTVSATYRPEGKPRRPELGVWIELGHGVERGAIVGELTDAFVPHTFAGTYAAEVEPQHGTPETRKRFGPPIHRLRVHRPAFNGERMREDDRGAHGLLGFQHRGLDERFQPAGWSWNFAKDLIGHPEIATLRASRSRQSAARSTNSLTNDANASGRVMHPRCPV